MRWNPDAEDRNIDQCDTRSGPPSYSSYSAFICRHDQEPVHENLHKEMDFEGPQEENDK